MGDPRRWRSSVRDIEFCLPDYAPEHCYIVHNASLPLPDFVKDIEFHGIVLGPTFLCNRYHPPTLTKTLEAYAFIKSSNAFKIAMPQDDYDCSAILERWVLDWGVDLLYTVCPEHWDVLYPNLSLTGKIRLGYTGYVADKMIDRSRHPKPFAARSVDVSYRARKLAPNFGRVGYVKGIIGDIFLEKAANQGLILDISTHPKDTIHGDQWLDFIEDSKFVLGSNSGSSLLDPEGEIRFEVERYLAFHPNASFDEVRDACFPMESERYAFTAISPRNIEAALLETVQILTPGSYNGIMLPEEHYIPFEPDGSNIHDVLAMMRDTVKVRKIASACKDAFLSVKELRYSYHVSEIIDEISTGVYKKRISGMDTKKIEHYIQKYNEYIQRYSKCYWPYHRLMLRAKQVAIALGAKRVKYLLKSRTK
jgi:hypothetical protein